MDLIDRQAAIDAIRHIREVYVNNLPTLIDKASVQTELMMLPSAQQKTKNRRFEKIVVTYPNPDLCSYPEYKGKPYFSIKYEENEEHYIGYGTYNPEVLSNFLKEYFMPSAQPEPKWIPVTERLPEYGTQVLAIHKDGDYEVNHVIDEEDGEWFLNGVIAWMPLPEPYKGEGESNALD